MEKIVYIQILSLHSPFDWKRPKRWLCYFIRKISNSYWNHSGIYVSIGHENYIVESDINGVQMIPYSNYQRHGIIKLSDATYEVEWERIEKHIGVTKYDFRNLILHQTLKEVFGIFLPPKNKGRKGEKFTCSEFVAYVIDLPEPWKYTPRDMSEL